MGGGSWILLQVSSEQLRFYGSTRWDRADCVGMISSQDSSRQLLHDSFSTGVPCLNMFCDNLVTDLVIDTNFLAI